MKEKKRFFMLAGILLVMLLTFISITLVSDYTRTRLIQRKQDEVKAYYTSLYFDSTGEGSAVAIDNRIGYVTFDLMNFIGDNVTERDIVYEIQEPINYYSSNNDKLSDDDDTLTSAENIYVRDVWNQPKKVGRDTYKYKYSIASNSGDSYDGEPIEGDSTPDNNFIFKHEVLEDSESANAVGKTHNVTVKIERNNIVNEDGDYVGISGTENISIVVQLLKPYKEVFIINMTISERLIVFTNTEITEFEHKIQELNIQTVDIFSHIETNTPRPPVTTDKEFSSKPLRVTLKWTDAIFNEVLTNTFPEGVIVTNLEDITSNSGTITLYIPQGASFNLQFYQTSIDYKVYAKVEIYDSKSSASDKYVLYDGNTYGGYTDKELIDKGDYKNYILIVAEDKDNLVH